MRPSYALINLSNLKYNYLNIRRKVKNAGIMAVVKADSYGHGVKEVCNALNSLKQKPEYFGVAAAVEGEELRKNKIKQPILVFEPVTPSEAEVMVKNNLTATVFEPRHLTILRKAGKGKKIIKVHVKVDTGMHRLGVNFNEAFDFIKKLDRNKNFKIEGVYTHFATSDEKDKSFAYLQLRRFNSVIDKLKEKGIDYGLAHCANSGAIMDLPESYMDMVRPGISLYGYYPSLDTSESVKLKPVMSVYSVVNSLKDIEEGESVSYGRKFYADTDLRIATVPFGYADGYRRDLTNKSWAIINNEIYNQVGTVTMDRIMFNINGNKKIVPGDEVILLGSSKDKSVDAWDWSRLLNTIPYEITCGISKRVKRIYK
jgi:alanine racemase